MDMVREAVSEPAVNLRHLPFELDAGIGARARIGVMVLATDQTLEHELRRLLRLDGVAYYESRLFNDATITAETLREMEARLPEAAGLILPGMDLNVVAYACTSGAMAIGEDVVFERIREVRPGIACTTPITAAMAGIEALGARRIALLTPYRDDLNQSMRSWIEARGVSVPVVGSFNEEDDLKAARISVASIERAVIEVGRHPEVDAVFVACTSLRVADIIASAEETLGKPVTSSNHALAWHCLRLAGVDDALPQFGRLYTMPLASRG
ncbi:maleate cis-trans isomerase family protein [Acuticoccus sp.]|uniref:maleate cis-trans isomerase family protein n=1 Tax=Acuticoccus sp. TaxID=1904378 RepID=UPI003B521C66